MLMSPADFEDDPFIDSRSHIQETGGPCKIDHQDSMMTEDQIR